jgi:hypothetical protein
MKHAADYQALLERLDGYGLNEAQRQAAAFSLAKRLTRDGIEIDVQIPGSAGKDWADEGI